MTAATGTGPGPLDLRLYLVTSGSDRRTVEVAAAAAGAGAGIVQVRAKDLEARDLLALTCEVARAVQAANPATRVVVDDRADVAHAARMAGEAVHGVHLGQDDVPVAAARSMLGADAVIGLTTGTLELVKAAELRRGDDRPDYLGAGPYRTTPTKDSGRPPLGVQGYPDLVAATTMPVVAIGDVTPADVRDLAATGVAGTAIVRALMGADDPASVARECLAAWDPAPAEPIRVSAVVLRDEAGRVLCVRKQGTQRVMLVGGKHDPGESARETAVREAAEEVGADLDIDALQEVGVFRCDAANEPGHHLIGHVFTHPSVAIQGAAAEIAELHWIDIDAPPANGAPLLVQHVLPRLRGASS